MTFAGIAVHNNDTLTISKAFVSLSLFALLSQPMTKVIFALPSFAGAIASFGRIQEYLTLPERADQRIVDDRSKPNVGSCNEEELEKPHSFSGSEDINVRLGSESMASLQGRFLAAEDKPPIIDIKKWEVQRGSFSLLLGPVGCGKSTLLKGLLGELPSFDGTIHTQTTRIAYCAQNVWLPNCTVKEAVIGVSDYNSVWYERVLETCALQQDIQSWPNGSDTLIGSKGISISGGQKQRIVSSQSPLSPVHDLMKPQSIARAIYSRNEFVVLDDVFSALDATTENEVFHNLLGPKGLFRENGITAVLASSSRMYSLSDTGPGALLTCMTSSSREKCRPNHHDGQ